MPYLLDTDVAIHIRDGSIEIVQALATRGEPSSICMPTLVELESGVFANPTLVDARRAGLTGLLARFPVLELTRDVVAAYGDIVAALGHARNKVFDRLIAATAIVNGLTLITINGADFRDIPDLRLEVWPSPAQ